MRGFLGCETSSVKTRGVLSSPGKKGITEHMDEERNWEERTPRKREGNSVQNDRIEEDWGVCY